MNANAQEENYPALDCDLRSSCPRLLLLGLSVLLLVTGRTALPATVQVDVGNGSPSFGPDDVTIHAGGHGAVDLARANPSKVAGGILPTVCGLFRKTQTTRVGERCPLRRAEKSCDFLQRALRNPFGKGK
jgi:hypothetical protein